MYIILYDLLLDQLSAAVSPQAVFLAEFINIRALLGDFLVELLRRLLIAYFICRRLFFLELYHSAFHSTLLLRKLINTAVFFLVKPDLIRCASVLVILIALYNAPPFIFA